jgi:sulfur-oxidizing protein SoxA
MQRRLIDCMRQARWPEPNYLADSIIALETFLQKNATGTVMETPGIKR